MYYDCRYLSACEAAWRIFSFDINYREPSVERLNYHLENEHSVLYEENDDIEQVIERSHRKTTKFLAWMKANEKYPEARNLTYNQFPTQFVWKEKDHEWTPRRCGFSIGRVHFAPPGSGERFYLRTLLNYIKGLTSFNDIKTVDDVKYNTFKEACFAMGLLDDDKEFIDAIIEASLWGIDLRLTHEQLKAYALAELETMLQSFGKSLSDFPPMPKADASLVPDVESRLIHDEMSYNRPVLAAQHDRMMSTMTSEQRNVYDKIMTRVKEDKSGLFFLYGYGGTGKTFIWRALCAALRSDGGIVLACASSGIAALLIPGGRTAHSRFGIPFTIDECSMCGVTPNTPLASLLIKAKLIIWDEAPMMHKHCNPVASIVDSTYPNLLGNIGKAKYFQSRAILAPKNTIVEQVNDYVFNLIPGEEKIYLSYDTPYHKNIDGDAVDDIHTPEFLNTIVASGFPNHRLRLKVGAPVMLLRNMDQSLGLCNGTRLIITKMGKFMLEGRVISGSNIIEKVFIPRLSLTPSDNRIPFKFKRRQFPIFVSFAMTINKS
ncbi:uncharacterized protein [Medicago truncatula]|uniref:uncharacterized protein n=1 Tax=Medicago truncatula TaxID=3880 RepID=UPI000D2F4372|nr:uncharacterized protein LOC11427021 [Medicago truncatula]